MRFALPLAAVTVLIGGAGLLLQGPLPGDVALTRGLQSVFGAAPVWADWLTATAKPLLLPVTVVVAAGLAWVVGGWRGAVSAPIAYGLAFAFDKLLRAAVFMPRPDPQLVAVADPSASSGLPSTFGLTYGALFGLALLARGGRTRGGPARLIAGVLLMAGLAARIALGGHWPSQMLASAALGLLLAAAALAVTRKLRWPKRGRR